MKKYKNRKYNNKTIKNNNIYTGGGSEQPMNLQDLTQTDIETLMQQGIMPEQLAAMAQEQGQPIPPIIQQMMNAGIQQPGAEQLQMQRTQQNTNFNSATATSPAQYTIDSTNFDTDSFIVCEPNIVLNGASNINANIVLPAAPSALDANTYVSVNWYGILAQNCTSVK